MAPETSRSGLLSYFSHTMKTELTSVAQRKIKGSVSLVLLIDLSDPHI